MSLPLNQHPLILAVAGPNGAGKSTFFEAHLRAAGLRFINADELARELSISPYEAAAVAAKLRQELVRQRESFVFETVLSDPVGEKVGFLRDCASRGYTVVLCYIGLASAELSEERVTMRVLQGGHDVPTDKLTARFQRTLANLHLAIQELPHVYVFDNTDLRHPFRKVAQYHHGALVSGSTPKPAWLEPS